MELTERITTDMQMERITSAFGMIQTGPVSAQTRWTIRYSNESRR